jgi:UrcA family protein
MKTQVIAAFAAICFTVPAVAMAAPVRTDVEQTRVVVRYDDLNVASPAGRAMLQHRVKRAVEDVCGVMPTGPDMMEASIQREACVSKAMAGAVAQIPSDVRMAAR